MYPVYSPYFEAVLFWSGKIMISAVEAIAAIDDKLSKRFLELDPAGYFIIYLDRGAGLICCLSQQNLVQSADSIMRLTWDVSLCEQNWHWFLGKITYGINV